MRKKIKTERATRWPRYTTDIITRTHNNVPAIQWLASVPKVEAKTCHHHRSTRPRSNVNASNADVRDRKGEPIILGLQCYIRSQPRSPLPTDEREKKSHCPLNDNTAGPYKIVRHRCLARRINVTQKGGLKTHPSYTFSIFT